MNLVEIAKSCGAAVQLSYADIAGDRAYIILCTDDQLHAYTEQVCKQMVEALEAVKDKTHREEFVARNLNRHQLNELLDMVGVTSKLALAAHKQMMGDRHE